MPTSVITPDQAKVIKRRLWDGETCEAISDDYEIGVSLILGIRSGQRWAAIEWPDGTTGRMSKKRGTQISKARRQAQKKLPVEVAKILKSTSA